MDGIRVERCPAGEGDREIPPVRTDGGGPGLLYFRVAITDDGHHVRGLPVRNGEERQFAAVPGEKEAFRIDPGRERCVFTEDAAAWFGGAEDGEFGASDENFLGVRTKRGSGPAVAPGGIRQNELAAALEGDELKPVRPVEENPVPLGCGRHRVAASGGKVSQKTLLLPGMEQTDLMLEHDSRAFRAACIGHDQSEQERLAGDLLEQPGHPPKRMEGEMRIRRSSGGGHTENPVGVSRGIPVRAGVSIESIVVRIIGERGLDRTDLGRPANSGKIRRCYADFAVRFPGDPVPGRPGGGLFPAGARAKGEFARSVHEPSLPAVDR